MLLTILLFTGIVIGSLASIIILYLLCVFIFSILPKNINYKDSEEGVEIFVFSNGMHVDFLLPAIHYLQDWWTFLDRKDFPVNTDSIPYMAFGWGDKGFYLDMPSWAELDPKIAVNAMLVPFGRTLMHVTPYETIPMDMAACERLSLSFEQYESLCRYIKRYFQIDYKNVLQVIPNETYNGNDRFFEAQGTYTALTTCNYWINRGLKEIGVRTATWTPIDKGIFYHLKKMKD